MTGRRGGCAQRRNRAVAAAAWSLMGLLAAVWLAGCSSGTAGPVSTTSATTAATAASGAANASAGPTSDLPASSAATAATSATSAAGTGTGAGGSGAGASTPVPTRTDSRPVTSFPSPVEMTAPHATAATAEGCQQLAGGGWQATFVVTLVGGTDWAVVPQHGPATPAGADRWTVVIRQGTGTGSQITLDRLEVGGGSPYRTATVVLGPGVSTSASCTS